MNGFRSRQIKHSNFWIHKTPDLTTYWLFIDVAKFGEDYKSFFLIINERNKINKGLTFIYNKEVLSFMELEQDEIYDELYTNTFDNAEAEIKIDLMNHYEELTKQQLWGRANMYYYVYESFHLTTVSKNQFLFTEREIAQINEGLKHLDNFGIKKELQTAIKKSEIINKLKVQISHSQ